MYQIKTVSHLSGVSVRTLHHYDEIGLLSPQKQDNGYRYYSEADVSRLQTILFYKYLGFPLKKIKELLAVESDDLHIHLKRQLTLLKQEKTKLLTLIDTLEKTIVSNERSISMSTEEKFKGFTYQDNAKYRKEAEGLYGKEVVVATAEKQKGKEEEIAAGFNRIFFAAADAIVQGVPATSETGVALAKQLHEQIRSTSFDCSLEVFSSIGYGYVANPEFKRNLDKFGSGTAQFMCDAIQQYVTLAKA